MQTNKPMVKKIRLTIKYVTGAIMGGALGFVFWLILSAFTGPCPSCNLEWAFKNYENVSRERCAELYEAFTADELVENNEYQLCGYNALIRESRDDLYGYVLAGMCVGVIAAVLSIDFKRMTLLVNKMKDRNK